MYYSLDGILTCPEVSSASCAASRHGCFHRTGRTTRTWGCTKRHFSRAVFRTPAPLFCYFEHFLIIMYFWALFGTPKTRARAPLWAQNHAWDDFGVSRTRVLHLFFLSKRKNSNESTCIFMKTAQFPSFGRQTQRKNFIFIR